MATPALTPRNPAGRSPQGARHNTRFMAWTTYAAPQRFYPLAGSPGKGIPVLVAQGRIGYTPNGVTVSSGGVTIYLDPIGA